MKRIALTIAALLIATPAFAGPLDGVWTGESQMRQGPQTITLDIKADGEKLTGTLKQAAAGAGAPIVDGKVKGNKFWFEQSLDMQGRHIVFKWSGELKGDELLVVRDIVTPDGSPPPVPPRTVTMKRVK